jgi:hypothetical protein
MHQGKSKGKQCVLNKSDKPAKKKTKKKVKKNYGY